MSLTSTNIGSGSGSYTQSGGVYNLSCTGGGGVVGTNDGMFYANAPVAGNVEIIAYIVSQSGSNAYAGAGLMFSDLSSTYPDASQCAMIGVCPQNGINFWSRTADDTTAAVTLGPSLAAPVWLRLTFNQNITQGFYSTNGINWVLVGQATMTFPSTYYSGMISYSNVSGATNVASFSNFYQLTNVPQLTTSFLPTWSTAAIGGTTGSFVANAGGSYTVSGTGNGFIGTSDSYYFGYQAVTGNCEITAYVSAMTGTDMYSFGGVMMSDLSPTYPQSAQLVSIVVNYGYNELVNWRTTDGIFSQQAVGPNLYVPTWLRINITDGTINVFTSSDGVTFTNEGTFNITLPQTYYMGLVVGSGDTTQNAVTFGQASAVLSAYMYCWLRADAFVTFSPSVSFWQDQSGQGYNASQSNSSNQPSLVLNSINALPAVVFNGTSSWMQFPTGFNNFAQGATIFLVVKPAVATALSQILNLGTGSSNDYNLGVEINASGEAEYFVYTSAGSTMTSVSYGSSIGTSAQLIEVVHTGTSATILTNGATPVTNTSMNSIPEPTAGRTNSYLGQASGGGNYFNGEIAEVIIYQTALSVVQRQSVENYLINKYNL